MVYAPMDSACTAVMPVILSAHGDAVSENVRVCSEHETSRSSYVYTRVNAEKQVMDMFSHPQQNT